MTGGASLAAHGAPTGSCVRLSESESRLLKHRANWIRSIRLNRSKDQQSAPRYEKAHEASNIINAIKATKIISRLDLRIRLADGDA